MIGIPIAERIDMHMRRARLGVGDDPVIFADRRDAGRRLAALLTHLRRAHVLVLALPRGGVPVAAEVAEALGAPLDVLVVRKLGVPMQPELAMGAIAPDGAAVMNEAVVSLLGIREEDIERILAREAEELKRRVRAYRGGRPPLDVRGRTVVLVDDGIATGATARAALRWLRSQAPSRVVLAVPVISRDTAAELRTEVDEIVAVETPEDLQAIGAWYLRFDQVSDGEVLAFLDAADDRHRTAATSAPPRASDADAAGGAATETEVRIPG